MRGHVRSWKPLVIVVAHAVKRKIPTHPPTIRFDLGIPRPGHWRCCPGPHRGEHTIPLAPTISLTWLRGHQSPAPFPSTLSFWAHVRGSVLINGFMSAGRASGQFPLLLLMALLLVSDPPNLSYLGGRCLVSAYYLDSVFFGHYRSVYIVYFHLSRAYFRGMPHEV